MDIILSHNNLDCDGLAALLAMARLRPGARPVLHGNLNRNVRDVLAAYGTGLPFPPRRVSDLPRQPIRYLILVDTQTLPADEAVLSRIRQSNPTIEIYDHHPLAEERPPAARLTRADTGATTTILVEEMQTQAMTLPPTEASLLLLGIYEDTGNLTYASTTPRDARAAAWLLEQGADLHTVSEYVDRPLSPRQWQVYEALMASARVQEMGGHTILLAVASAPDYVEELSTLAHKLRDIYDPDAAFILVQMEEVVQIIARSRSEAMDVATILKPLGGGGHGFAAAALVRGRSLSQVQADLWASLSISLAPAVTAGDIMTREPHTVSTGTTIAATHDALRRYGHEALPILDDGRLLGLITRRDADKAIHHGLGNRPVESFATFDVPTITPGTSVSEIQDKMEESDIGQLPVMEGDRLVGIVTRTDVIRRWRGKPGAVNLAARLEEALDPQVRRLLTLAGKTAAAMGFSLYLVGGFVRDLLLGLPNLDLDLVVEGDAIALAQRLARQHGGRTKSHARFGTAKWIVPRAASRPPSPCQGEGGLPPVHHLSLDFVTARTEFYEHPAALPLVEAASLRQDLYRRDFTINTMAICLSGPRYGDLVDFYGGKRDLERRLIRVLHNLSFVEDATRILRAARLAERLGFTLEPHTADLIPTAWDSLDRISGDRLRHELNLILQEAEPERIIAHLARLDVLQHLHPALDYTPWLAEKYATARAAVPQWRSWGWGSGSRGGDEAIARAATYVALLTYHLTRADCEQLRARLNIGGEVGRIMGQVDDLRTHVPDLASGLTPSRIYHLLQRYLVESLFVVWLAEDAPAVKEAIALYVSTLRTMRTDVDGSTLQALGLPPGPAYGRLLRTVLDARLDGQVTSRAEEEALLRRLLVAQPSSALAGPRPAEG